MFTEHLNVNNLHHAYLIEGERDEILQQILFFLKDLGLNVNTNSDICRISLDSFKVEDARNLKVYAIERGYSSGNSSADNRVCAKKFFIISANNFLLEAQNSLLKLFEEPIDNTHFFIIVPDANIFLKTLFSRFYFISSKQKLSEEKRDAEKFIALPVKKRIDFLKDLLIENKNETEEDNEIVILDSARSKALRFLNALESVLHQELLSKSLFDRSDDFGFFDHFFKVRKFLRQSGSSVKTLMESVALTIPNF